MDGVTSGVKHNENITQRCRWRKLDLVELAKLSEARAEQKRPRMAVFFTTTQLACSGCFAPETYR